MRTRGERRENNNRIKQRVINRVLTLHKIYHSRYSNQKRVLIEPFDIESEIEECKVYIGKEGKTRLRNMRRKGSFKCCPEVNCNYCLRGKLHNYIMLEERAKYEYEEYFGRTYNVSFGKVGMWD